MEWIDEQIEYWQSILKDHEKNPEGLTMIERMRPLTELNSLLQFKLGLLLNK